MTQTAAAVPAQDEAGSEIRIGQLALRFLIDGPASGSSLTLFEMTVPSGANMPAAHSHDGFDETIFGLEGVLTMTLQGQQIGVGPGQRLFIRRGAVHRFDNLSGAAARVLCIITPGILGSGYFREVQAIVSAAPGGPPDFAAIGAVMLRHGLTPAKG